MCKWAVLSCGWPLKQKDGLGIAINAVDFVPALQPLALWAGAYISLSTLVTANVKERYTCDLKRMVTLGLGQLPFRFCILCFSLLLIVCFNVRTEVSY